MDIINVITIESGLISEITSFVIDSTHLKTEAEYTAQARTAELEFQKKAREINGEPLDQSIDEFMEEYDDSFEYGDKEVRIIWSHEIHELTL